MWNVIGTNTYLKEMEELEETYKRFAKKLPNKLKQNPFSGKPLGYKFLREKKIKEKRIYYLVYEDLELVLLVAISKKKNQQITINHIKNQLKYFRKIAENIKQEL